jgi:hypothetical protein
MAQQQLYGGQVRSVFQQMRRETMPPLGLCRVDQNEVAEGPRVRGVVAPIRFKMRHSLETLD